MLRTSGDRMRIIGWRICEAGKADVSSDNVAAVLCECGIEEGEIFGFVEGDGDGEREECYYGPAPLKMYIIEE